VINIRKITQLDVGLSGCFDQFFEPQILLLASILTTQAGRKTKQNLQSPRSYERKADQSAKGCQFANECDHRPCKGPIKITQSLQ
jgi:hypothetical protein